MASSYLYDADSVDDLLDTYADMWAHINAHNPPSDGDEWTPLEEKGAYRILTMLVPEDKRMQAWERLYCTKEPA